MRVFISALLSLSLAAPALALPVARPAPAAVSEASGAIAPVARKQARTKPAPRARATKARRGKPDLGGIRPLVGSGDY